MSSTESEILLSVRDHATRISIEHGSLDHIGKYIASLSTPHLVGVCSDTHVWDLYGSRVADSLTQEGLDHVVHLIPPGDGSKTTERLFALIDELAGARFLRDAILLALGGGVVTDLTGFAAAIWMRGLRYVNCPTTLEACIDAAIGGKTGINHSSGKNLIGAFHHPERVVIDPGCLSTLSKRDLSAGLAECVKHALIADLSLFEWYEKHAEPILNLEPDITQSLIRRNVAIKVGVVAQDEKEHGRRAILNFGHTLGHAIEHYRKYELRHGESVALGIICATRISHQLGLIDAIVRSRVEALIARFNLPTTLSSVDLDQVVALTHSDKKIQAGRRRWVLLDGIGSTVIRDDVPDALVRDALASIVAE